ncbi:MAG TPA: DUF3662 domain-containing protein [Chloroflexi bacterium]|nr:MAG: hypothetical protein B6243_08290 [Anaerolineaceae bacterium 4572_5.2]HEY84910.1 DUF3662 domain-containing protein [Chloroflexota bacterium]
MNPLNHLENQIERLVESPFKRLFKTRLHPADLAKALAAAMENRQRSDGQGGFIAPGVYQIALSEDDYQFLHQKSDLNEEIAALKRYLDGLLLETGGRTENGLRISIQPRSGLLRGQIEITNDQ